MTPELRETINAAICEYADAQDKDLRKVFSHENAGSFSFVYDFGFGSIDVMDIIMILEAKFEKKIDNREIVKVRTVGDLYKLFDDEDTEARA